jgi:hypothetical protein
MTSRGLARRLERLEEQRTSSDIQHVITVTYVNADHSPTGDGMRADIGDLIQGIDRAAVGGSGIANNSYRDVSSLPDLADSCVEG